MDFRIIDATPLLDTPGGSQIGAVVANDIVTGTGQVSGKFTEVVTDDKVKGWILTSLCKALGGEPRPVLALGNFVATCVSAEGAFNEVESMAPWLVSADYLIALSVLLTDLTNAAAQTPNSDAVGPLQVSSATWQDFLTNGGTLVGNFKPRDFDNALSQVFGAAHRMHVNARDISKQRTPAGSQDAYVPSYLDLFHADMIGSAKAAADLSAAAAGSAAGTTSIDDALKNAISAQTMADFRSARSQYAGTGAKPPSVEAFVKATGDALDDAFQKAFDLIQKFVPDELPQIKQGEALWYDVAQTELQTGVAEPDARILEYFKATDFRPLPTSPSTAWCGAFVAFCMANSGNSVAAASIPKGSACAANWKSWGTPLPVKSSDIPPGAVVVLAPGEGIDGSGHVAFFSSFSADGKFVELLGGNQHNRVKKSDFPASLISTINWLDLAPTVMGDQFEPGVNADPTPIAQEAFDLIVEFEVSSRKVYEKKYFSTEWPGESAGVTVAIGYDVGQTSAATFTADWKAELPKPMFDALLGAVGVKGVAARPLAAQLKPVVNISWDTAIKVHSTRVIPRWVGVVKKALPNTDKLDPLCFGALVSLTFNRGASYSNPKPRYSEMRAIRGCMEASDFVRIPQLIRDMKRLWPTTAGLQSRRDREAAFFEQGLAKMPPP